MALTDKLEHVGAGIALTYNDKRHLCDTTMACLFLGNDDHTRAYCVCTTRMNDEYHIFDEAIGRLSPDFLSEITEMLHNNKVERLIFVCNDEDLRSRIRKELGVRVLFEDEKRRNNASVILREWFARDKPGTEDALLKIWGECREALKSNYPPVRDCIVRLLDFYDKRSRKKAGKPLVMGGRAGYG
jgi:hypothetical protein